jgi:hypothetical protein
MLEAICQTALDILDRNSGSPRHLYVFYFLPVLRKLKSGFSVLSEPPGIQNWISTRFFCKFQIRQLIIFLNLKTQNYGIEPLKLIFCGFPFQTVIANHQLISLITQKHLVHMFSGIDLRNIFSGQPMLFGT